MHASLLAMHVPLMFIWRLPWDQCSIRTLIRTARCLRELGSGTLSPPGEKFVASRSEDTFKLRLHKLIRTDRCLLRRRVHLSVLHVHALALHQFGYSQDVVAMVYEPGHYELSCLAGGLMDIVHQDDGTVCDLFFYCL